MRKNFLLLFLLALMPFSAFAADDPTEYTITPKNASKTYGENVTAVKTGWFTIAPTPGDKAAVAAALQLLRVDDGEDVGEYTYTYKSGSQYNGADLIIDGTGTFSIEKKALDSFDGSAGNAITVTWKKHFYTSDLAAGAKFKPTASDFEIEVDLAVDALDGKLVAGTDFDVLTTDASYGDNNTVGGSNYITIQGKGNYSGTLQLDFTVEGTQLTGTATYKGDDLYYKGSAYSTADFDAEDFVLGNFIPGTAFTVSKVENGLNAGNATITLSGNTKNGYAGDVTVNIPIKPVPVTEDVQFTIASNPEYNTLAVLPTFTDFGTGIYFKTSATEAKGANLELTEDDYTLTGATNAYEATAGYEPKFIIAFKGNFTGASQKHAFTIMKKEFNTSDFKVEWTQKDDKLNEVVNYPYNNADVKPAVTVSLKVGSEYKTVPASNYDLVWSADIKSVGTGKQLVSLKAKKDANGNNISNFTGTITLNKAFNIVKRNVTVKAADINAGMGVEVTPSLTYGNFPSGVNAKNAGITTTISYVKLNAKGEETSTTLNQAQINDPANADAIGSFNIHVTVAGEGTANYNFVAPKDAKGNNEYGKLTRITGQIVVKLKDKTIGYGDAFPTDWEFEHVSGLSEANSTGAAFANILGTIDGSKFALVNGETTPLAVSATGYDVTYNGGNINNGNYAITVQPGKLIVTKKLIAASMVTFNEGNPIVYSGKTVNPFVKITHNGQVLSTSLYTVDYNENGNAGNYTVKISGESENYTTTYEKTLVAGDPEVVAGTNKVGDKVTRNYIEAEYTIQRKELTVKSANFTGNNSWTYGTDKSVFTSTATIEGLIDADASKAAALLAGEKVDGFNGTLEVQLISTATIGTFNGGLEAKFIAEDGTVLVNGGATTFVAGTKYAADNYYITVVKSNINIKKGTIIAKVKDIDYPYGETTPTFSLEAVSGMDAEEAANFDAIVSYENKFSYDKNANKNIGTYTIKYTGAAPTATNYDVKFADGKTAYEGTLTVTKRPVKFKAADKNIAYGNLAAEWNPAVNGTYVQLVTEPGKYYSLLTGTVFTDLIASVAAASQEIGKNDIVLTAKASDIYDVTVEKGILTITDGGVGDITLARVAKADVNNVNANTAAKLIEQRDGQVVNVKFSDFALKAEKWYPLVLPFATSVKEIAKQFGYAVVDVLNENATDGNIHLKLHMGNIAANTPFIVKVFEDINMKDVEFKTVRIEKAEPVVGDANGIQFVGTYTGKADGFRSNQYYFSTAADLNDYYKGNDTNKTYLRPLGAYFQDNSADAAAASRTIFIEEANGETTAISAIAADGSLIEADGWYSVNGVKMQGAPTQKGVYVRNGKKVVIK